MFNRITTLAALAISAAVVAPAANAATVTIDSISGAWVSANPAAGVSGVGTNSISWGTPATSGGQSGYTFEPAATPFVAGSVGTDFSLGTFTHHNRPITGTFLTSAVLQLTFGYSIDGVAQTLTNSYNFAHWETDNDPRPAACADGGTYGVGINSAGCADRVTATLNSASAQTVTIGGVEYTFNVTGFLVDGVLMDQFWTRENAANSAMLYASFEEYNVPAPVPLPASALLLLAGVGGLGALHRRRKA